MKRTRKNFNLWLKLSTVTFLLLILIHFALPLIFLLFQIDSFSVGQQGWILRWQNDETGSGIQFNLMFLLAIATVIGLILTIIRTQRKHTY